VIIESKGYYFLNGLTRSLFCSQHYRIEGLWLHCCTLPFHDWQNKRADSAAMFFLSCTRHVFARPSGKRCLVVSSNGMTISRVRNGSILHRFPSALPNGSKRDISGPASSYSILDCIFHEVPKPNFPFHLVCQLVDLLCPLAFRPNSKF
jgi:hypothetical protein